VDLRVVPKESFGAALQYFTGSRRTTGPSGLPELGLDVGQPQVRYGVDQRGEAGSSRKTFSMRGAGRR
jgi:hypothetical protein